MKEARPGGQGGSGLARARPHGPGGRAVPGPGRAKPGPGPGRDCHFLSGLRSWLFASILRDRNCCAQDPPRHDIEGGRLGSMSHDTRDRLRKTVSWRAIAELSSACLCRNHVLRRPQNASTLHCCLPAKVLRFRRKVALDA